MMMVVKKAIPKTVSKYMSDYISPSKSTIGCNMELLSVCTNLKAVTCV